MHAEPPFVVALNLTRRCNLRCAHCYLDAGTRRRGAPEELGTAEIDRIIDDIAALGGETLLVLTGGEPLLRHDLCRLARHARAHGLPVVVGTNGTLLDEARVAALRTAGVSGLGISLDSLDPAYHDRFRGRPGAWARTMAGIEACRRGGLLLQLHFSVTDENSGELDAMIAFAREAGAAVLNVFFLVCTGRGERMSEVSPAVHEAVLARVAEAAREEASGLLVRARCAPHFQRIALARDPPLPLTPLHGYQAGGCMAGRRYCRVTPEGELTPCPYMAISAGSLREARFAELWREAPLFAELRAPKLTGRCGRCEYASVCGGCRARALARTGRLMAEDDLCSYQPRGGGVLPDPEACAPLAWSPEAEARLRHVPSFVRGFVRRRAEAYVRERGDDRVEPEHLATLARHRFGANPSSPGGGPRRPPAREGRR